MQVSRIFLCLLGFTVLFFAACSDDNPSRTEQRPGYYAGVQCHRLELTTFDDCLYKPQTSGKSGVNLYDDESIAEFCESSCNAIEGISGDFDDHSAQDLALLKGIKHVTVSVSIEQMNNLTSLHGLEDLEFIGKNLKLMWNPKLQNTEALSSLKHVEKIITIQGNKQLKTLNGLEALRHAHAISISINNELVDITALNNIEELEGFGVDDNPKLPACQAENIRDMHGLEYPDSVIVNNGTGSCD